MTYNAKVKYQYFSCFCLQSLPPFHIQWRSIAMDHLKCRFWFSSNSERTKNSRKKIIYHLKALIVDNLNPEDWGRGLVIGLPCPLFVKNVLFRRRERGKLLIMPRPCPSGLLLSTISGIKWGIECLCAICTFTVNWVQS